MQVKREPDRRHREETQAPQDNCSAINTGESLPVVELGSAEAERRGLSRQSRGLSAAIPLLHHLWNPKETSSGNRSIRWRHYKNSTAQSTNITTESASLRNLGGQWILTMSVQDCKPDGSPTAPRGDSSDPKRRKGRLRWTDTRWAPRGYWVLTTMGSSPWLYGLSLSIPISKV